MFSSERCIALTRMLERLTPALPSENVAAVKGSLAAWQRVARDPVWRDQTDPSAALCLRHQIEVWRDIVIVGTSPSTFEQPQAPLQEVANVIPLVRALWVQLVTGLVSVGVLATGAWLIAEYGKGQPWGSFVSALGLFGVTASSLWATAKKRVNSLVERVKSAVLADELAKAATSIPIRPRSATVKAPGRLSTPGSFAESITLSKLSETRAPSNAALRDDARASPNHNAINSANQ